MVVAPQTASQLAEPAGGIWRVRSWEFCADVVCCCPGTWATLGMV